MGCSGRSVDKLIYRAIENKILYFSITDHDNMDSYSQVQNLFKRDPNSFPDDFIFIPGVELTTKSSLMDQQDFHLVALFPQLAIGHSVQQKNINMPLFNAFQKMLTDNLQVRQDRMRWLMNSLNVTHKMGLVWEEFLEFHNARTGKKELIQRPDVAMFLVHKKIASSIQRAFDLLINIDIPSQYFELESMISLVAQLGVPVLAHPLQFVKQSPQLTKAFESWHALGLRVIEIEHPAMTESDKRYLKRIKKVFRLYESIASDFHNEERSAGWGSNFGNSKGNEAVGPVSKQDLIRFLFK